MVRCMSSYIMIDSFTPVFGRGCYAIYLLTLPLVKLLLAREYSTACPPYSSGNHNAVYFVVLTKAYCSIARSLTTLLLAWA